MRHFLKGLATRITTTTTRLRKWLGFKLLYSVPVEIEVRHGAHRARVKTLWRGQLLRAEIPINTRPAGTSAPAPLNYVAPGQEQKVIDEFTAAEPWDPMFPEQAEHKRGKACPFCGHTEWMA